MAKTLIAYFSHTGENYFGGQIRSMSKGNTAVAAEFAQKAVGGDLFEIRTVKAIASKCLRATVLNGFAMSGQTAQNSQAAVKRDTLKRIANHFLEVHIRFLL